MNIGSSKFLVFINVAIELCQCLPLYFSKYSKKDFTVHQLLILLVLKQKLKCSYEDLVDDLKTRPIIVKAIGLKRIPDDSTLKKFAKNSRPRLSIIFLKIVLIR